MKFDKNPSRAAMLRDLLLDYQTRMADNPPMPPADVDMNDDEALEAFYRHWQETDPNAAEFTPEGNYPVPDGRPDAAMVPNAPFDIEQRDQLMNLMQTPPGGPAPALPPGQRNRALAELMMRRG